jgi:peptidyl-prolyl cis-trans isomerase B (cyclophilin B)
MSKGNGGVTSAPTTVRFAKFRKVLPLAHRTRAGGALPDQEDRRRLRMSRRIARVATKKERQRKLARDAHQRRLERQVERARRARRWAVAAVAFVVVAAVGVGVAAIGGVFSSNADKSASAATTTPSATTTPTATPTATPSPSGTPAMVDGKCVYIPSGTAARKVSAPPATPDTSATYTATFNTNRGAIVVDLLGSKAPCTVNSFVSLADQKFFNNTPCPRLSNTQGLYILQCGDPTGTGSGTPGYGFNSENLAGATYPAGTLAMANSGQPDTNESQFFFVFKATDLPPSYTPFGKVVSGLSILQDVGNRGFGAPLNPYGGGKPKESVQFESVTISKT